MRTIMGFEYSNGNKKIGKDTIIFNITTSTDCPSAEMCPYSKKSNIRGKKNRCYSLVAERLRPSVLAFRRRQAEYWDTHSAEHIARDISEAHIQLGIEIIKYVRVSESGDFRNMTDIRKLIKIAKLLSNLKFYTYTKRKDLINKLDGRDLPENLVINLSFKKKSLYYNNYVDSDEKDMNRSTLTCIHNCRNCSFCKSKMSIQISSGGK